MKLILKVNKTEFSGEQCTENHKFDLLPVSFGRGNTCDLVLDDPTKGVSKVHGQLSEENNELCIIDTSSNGVYINGSLRPLGMNERANIASGDHFIVGDFKLSVEYFSAEPQSDDPFEAVEFKTNDADGSPVAHASAHRALSNNEDDWFADLADHSQRDLGSPIPPPSTQQQETSWPDFDLEPIPAKYVSPTASGGQGESDFSWTDISAPIPPSATGQRKQVASTETATPIRKNHSVKAEGRDNRNDLEVLLRAAGLEPESFSEADTKQLSIDIGTTLKGAVEAIILILHSRDQVKRTMHSDVTQLANVNNNPLKFSLDTADALQKLLTPSHGRQYVGAKEAIEEALEDISIHQVALLDAMQTAVGAMLHHFAPQELEVRVQRDHPISSLLPVAKQAALWALFEKRFEEISTEAVSEFGDLFSKELSDAYHQKLRQIGKIRRN